MAQETREKASVIGIEKRFINNHCLE